MAAMAAGSTDVDKPGKYPVVLSDALLGKASKDIYTGIRYNHKPDTSPNSSHSPMRLRPSDSDPSSYDLSFKDNSEKYSYNGVRTSGDGQFVLVFDPVKKHFVLHKIDSTFDMNLVGAPWEDDASTLRTQYPQLSPPPNPQADPPQRRTSKSSKKAATTKVQPKSRQAEKPKKSKPPPREPTPEAEEEEEEEDSDDVLTIEYPDGPPSSQPYKYQSTPIIRRDVSEDVSDEDEDAEGEEYEDERNQDVDHLKLPSPANNGAGNLSDEDLELDLEAELEEALKDTTGNGANESDESEEE